jgi:hypothetical protein
MCGTMALFPPPFALICVSFHLSLGKMLDIVHPCIDITAILEVQVNMSEPLIPSLDSACLLQDNDLTTKAAPEPSLIITCDVRYSCLTLGIGFKNTMVFREMVNHAFFNKNRVATFIKVSLSSRLSLLLTLPKLYLKVL